MVDKDDIMTNSSIDYSGTKRPSIKNNWFKNVSSSFKQAATDELSNYNPTVKEFSNLNSEVFNKAVQNFRQTDRSFPKALKQVYQNNTIVKTLRDASNNAMSDLKTGKFYNKEREGETINEMMTFDSFDKDSEDAQWNNYDLDSLDFSEDDIGFSDSDNKSSKAEHSSADRNIQLNKINVVTADRSASEIIRNNVKMTEAQNKNSDKNTLFNMEYNMKFHEESMAETRSMHNGLSAFFEYNKGAMDRITEASTTYFQEDLALSQKLLQSVENLYSISAEYYKPKTVESTTDKTSDRNPVASDGSLDLAKYGDSIKTNIRTLIEEGTTVSMDQLMQIAKSAASNPLYFGVKAVTSSLIPKTTKHLMTQFNETLETFGQGLINKFNSMAEEELDYEDEDNVMKSTINKGRRLIGKVFGFTPESNGTSLARYEKGPVPFDGITKKAIVDVIPMYLRKILSTLNKDKDELLFDYQTGEAVYKSNIKQKKATDDKDSIISGFNGLIGEFSDLIKSTTVNGNIMSSEDQASAKEIAREAFFNMVKNPANSGNIGSKQWIENLTSQISLKDEFTADDDLKKSVLQSLASMINGNGISSTIVDDITSTINNSSAPEAPRRNGIGGVKDRIQSGYKNTVSSLQNEVGKYNSGFDNGNSYLQGLISGRNRMQYLGQSRNKDYNEIGKNVEVSMLMDDKATDSRTYSSSREYKSKLEEAANTSDRTQGLIENIRDMLHKGIVVYPMGVVGSGSGSFNVDSLHPSLDSMDSKYKEKVKNVNDILKGNTDQKDRDNKYANSDLDNVRRYITKNKNNVDIRRKLSKFGLTVDEVLKDRSKLNQVVNEFINNENDESLLPAFQSNANMHYGKISERNLDSTRKQYDTKTFMGKARTLLDIPVTLFEAILAKSNNTLYKMMFGKERVDGGVSIITDSFAGTINNLQKFLKEKFSKTHAFFKKYLLDPLFSKEGFLYKNLIGPLSEKIFKPIGNWLLNKTGLTGVWDALKQRKRNRTQDTILNETSAADVASNIIPPNRQDMHANMREKAQDAISKVFDDVINDMTGANGMQPVAYDSNTKRQGKLGKKSHLYLEHAFLKDIFEREGINLPKSELADIIRSYESNYTFDKTSNRWNKRKHNNERPASPTDVVPDPLDTANESAVEEVQLVNIPLISNQTSLINSNIDKMVSILDKVNSVLNQIDMNTRNMGSRNRNKSKAHSSQSKLIRGVDNLINNAGESGPDDETRLQNNSAVGAVFNKKSKSRKENNIDPDLFSKLDALAKERNISLSLNSGKRDRKRQLELWNNAKNKLKSDPKYKDYSDDKIEEALGKYMANPNKLNTHLIGAAVDIDPEVASQLTDEELFKYGLYRPDPKEPFHIESLSTKGLTSKQIKENIKKKQSTSKGYSKNKPEVQGPIEDLYSKKDMYGLIGRDEKGRSKTNFDSGIRGKIQKIQNILPSTIKEENYEPSVYDKLVRSLNHFKKERKETKSDNSDKLKSDKDKMENLKINLRIPNGYKIFLSADEIKNHNFSEFRLKAINSNKDPVYITYGDFVNSTSDTINRDGTVFIKPKSKPSAVDKAIKGAKSLGEETKDQFKTISGKILGDAKLDDKGNVIEYQGGFLKDMVKDTKNLFQEYQDMFMGKYDKKVHKKGMTIVDGAEVEVILDDLEDQTSNQKLLKAIRKGSLGLAIGTFLPFLPGGSLFGAIGGVAASMANNSKTLKETMFGRDDSTQTVTEAFTKKFGIDPKKGIAKAIIYGGGGLIAGAMLGNPYLGLAIGGMAGFGSEVQYLKDKLFGNEETKKKGIIPKPLVELLDKKVKPALAFAGIGSVAGLIGGIGAFPGMLIAGSLGILAQMDKVKELVSDVSKNILGKFLKAYDKYIGDPLSRRFGKNGSYLLEWFGKRMFEPLKEAFNPIKAEIKYRAKQIGKVLLKGAGSVFSGINEFIKKHFGVSTSGLFNKIYDKLSKGGIFDKVIWSIGRLISAPVRRVQKSAGKLESKQWLREAYQNKMQEKISNGLDGQLTADERAMINTNMPENVKNKLNDNWWKDKFKREGIEDYNTLKEHARTKTAKEVKRSEDPMANLQNTQEDQLNMLERIKDIGKDILDFMKNPVKYTNDHDSSLNHAPKVKSARIKTTDEIGNTLKPVAVSKQIASAQASQKSKSLPIIRLDTSTDKEGNTTDITPDIKNIFDIPKQKIAGVAGILSKVFHLGKWAVPLTVGLGMTGLPIYATLPLLAGGTVLFESVRKSGALSKLIIDPLQKRFGKLGEKLVGWLGKRLLKPMARLVKNIGTSIKDVLMSVKDMVLSLAKGALSKLWSGVKGIAGFIGDRLGGKSIIDKITGKIEGYADKFIQSGLSKGIGTLFNGLLMAPAGIVNAVGSAADTGSDAIEKKRFIDNHVKEQLKARKLKKTDLYEHELEKLRKNAEKDLPENLKNTSGFKDKFKGRMKEDFNSLQNGSQSPSLSDVRTATTEKIKDGVASGTERIYNVLTNIFKTLAGPSPSSNLGFNALSQYDPENSHVSDSVVRTETPQPDDSFIGPSVLGRVTGDSNNDGGLSVTEYQDREERQANQGLIKNFLSEFKSERQANKERGETNGLGLLSIFSVLKNVPLLLKGVLSTVGKGVALFGAFKGISGIAGAVKNFKDGNISEGLSDAGGATRALTQNKGLLNKTANAAAKAGGKALGKWATTEGAEAVVRTGFEGQFKAFFKKVIQAFVKKFGVEVSERAATSLLGKISQTVLKKSTAFAAKYLGGPVGLAFIAYDLGSGFLKAPEYFDIDNSSVNFKMRVCSALAKALSGLTFGIISASFLATVAYGLVTTPEEKAELALSKETFTDEYKKSEFAKVGLTQEQYLKEKNKLFGIGRKDAYEVKAEAIKKDKTLTDEERASQIKGIEAQKEQAKKDGTYNSTVKSTAESVVKTDTVSTEKGGSDDSNRSSNVSTIPSNVQKQLNPTDTKFSSLTGDKDAHGWVLNRVNQMAKKLGATLNINSGLRTKEEQQQLWDERKKSHPNESDSVTRRWVASPEKMNSHYVGTAVDVQTAGTKLKGLSNDDLAQYGLYRPYSNEQWHYEPVETKGMNGSKQMAKFGTPSNPLNVPEDGQGYTSEASSSSLWDKVKSTASNLFNSTTGFFSNIFSGIGTGKKGDMASFLLGPLAGLVSSGARGETSTDTSATSTSTSSGSAYTNVDYGKNNYKVIGKDSQGRDIVEYQKTSVGDGDKASFIKSIAGGALSGAAKYGDLPSISLAQASLESGWGKSGINNNLFGIKADSSWKGPITEISSGEEQNGKMSSKVSKFRVYPSPKDSVEDHSKFLYENSRYAKAGFYDAAKMKDYAKAAEALKKAGYATDSAYASKLIKQIQANKLNDYDNVKSSNISEASIKGVEMGGGDDSARASIKRSESNQYLNYMENTANKINDTISMDSIKNMSGNTLDLSQIISLLTQIRDSGQIVAENTEVIKDKEFNVINTTSNTSESSNATPVYSQSKSDNFFSGGNTSSNKTKTNSKLLNNARQIASAIA